MDILFGLPVVANHLEGRLQALVVEAASHVRQLEDELLVPVVLAEQLAEAGLLVLQFALLLELGVGGAASNRHLRPRSPLLDEALDGIGRLSLKQVLRRDSLVLEPASDVLPRLKELLLLKFANNFGRASDILLLNHILFLNVVCLNLLRLVLSHGNHLKGLLVLRLAPLGQGSTAVASPEHVANLGQRLVLISCHRFVASKLTDVLETALPHRLHHHVLDAVGKMSLALRMGSPLQEDEAQATLEVA
mmetsp:Transcript_18535/g.24896  ORF Transcript_18535/g.24896 Transcript_18535/m.24896 type:complete len:248 (-) Transcript_18535:1726-2469(-)